MINLIQPLPFYDRLEEQNRFRENSFGIAKYLSGNELIPFQIPVSEETTSISKMRLVGMRYIFDIDMDSITAEKDLLNFEGSKSITESGLIQSRGSSFVLRVYQVFKGENITVKGSKASGSLTAGYTAIATKATPEMSGQTTPLFFVPPNIDNGYTVDYAFTSSEDTYLFIVNWNQIRLTVSSVKRPIEVLSTQLGKRIIFNSAAGIKFKRLTNFPVQPPTYVYEDIKFCPDYYHFEVTTNTGKMFFSEKFYINGEGLCDSPINFEIEAWNSKNTGKYSFEYGFKYKAFFNSFITYQQGEMTDDYLTDGYERNIISRRVIQFPLSFTVDPVCDNISNGLLVLTSFDNFVIKENGNTHVADYVTCEITPVEGSSFFQLDFKMYLKKDTDVIKTLC